MNIAYNMDCMEAMRTLPDNCIDLTVTSPPYDNIRDYHGYTFDYKATLKELYRVTKPGGWLCGLSTIRQKTGVKQGHHSDRRYLL